MSEFLSAPRDPSPSGARRVWTYLQTAASLKYSTWDDLKTWLQQNMVLAAGKITSGIFDVARLGSGGTAGQFLKYPASGTTPEWADAPAADALDIHDRLTTEQTAPDGADRVALSDESETGAPTKWAALNTILAWVQTHLSIDAARITSGVLDPDRLADGTDAEAGDWLIYNGSNMTWGRPPVGLGQKVFTYELPVTAKSGIYNLSSPAVTVTVESDAPAGIAANATRGYQVNLPFLPPDFAKGLWAVAVVADVQTAAVFIPWGIKGTVSSTKADSEFLLPFADDIIIGVQYTHSTTLGTYIQIEGFGDTLQAQSKIEFYLAP